MTENEIIQNLIQAGATVMLVGGAVRDEILGIPSNDRDFEAFNISVDDALAAIGDGAFLPFRGWDLIRVHGMDIEIGISDLSIFEDARRRDFTVNAMMRNMGTGELVDFFGGMDDLRNGILRHVSRETFGRDPIRVLRAMRFSSRSNWTVAHETVELSRGLIGQSLSIAFDRVMNEFIRWSEQAVAPMVGIEFIRACGWAEIFGIPATTVVTSTDPIMRLVELFGGADGARASRVRLPVQILRRMDAVGRPDPILRGRDLIGLGIPGGEAVGRILADALIAQINGEFNDLNSGLAWVTGRIS